MKLSRTPRFLAALAALFGMLFMQLAVAAYACPGLATDGKTQAAPASAQMAMQEMTPCADMDPAQPSLCHAHSQAGDQSLDKPQTPPVQGFVAVGLAASPVLIDVTHPPATASPEVLLLARTTAPPLSIQHCCFRI